MKKTLFIFILLCYILVLQSVEEVTVNKIRVYGLGSHENFLDESVDFKTFFGAYIDMKRMGEYTTYIDSLDKRSINNIKAYKYFEKLLERISFNVVKEISLGELVAVAILYSDAGDYVVELYDNCYYFRGNLIEYDNDFSNLLIKIVPKLKFKF